MEMSCPRDGRSRASDHTDQPQSGLARREPQVPARRTDTQPARNQRVGAGVDRSATSRSNDVSRRLLSFSLGRCASTRRDICSESVLRSTSRCDADVCALERGESAMAALPSNNAAPIIVTARCFVVCMSISRNVRRRCAPLSRAGSRCNRLLQCEVCARSQLMSRSP